MILLWKKDNLKVLPIQGVRGKTGGNKMLVLLPGYNEVDDDTWKIVKNLTYDKKQLVEKAKSLEDEKLKFEDKEEIIMGCYNRETLTSWKKSTLDETLRKLCMDQLETLGKKGK